ncbi:sugar ABC transporter substrate-binding protein [Rossellomorea marisflavi]|uniref:extracellular solute-binding protein n=1 Tax=Rossellomorea marisflavi TaxID=189381 RepID=UPI0025CB564D|nr:extracellular solute-binding protein [Rossellomorea marisflavi]GLI83748.1 sugar ABC transporter substrate-binding protein [Rossellomorea marisflavi]
MNKRMISRLGSVGLAGMLLLGGCSGEKGSSSSSEGGDGKITWMNILHTASPPTDTIVDEIEKKTDTEIEFSWVPDASKEERINTAIASDSLADIVTITMMDNSSVRNAMKSGMFWNVEDYLDDYPNLKEISEDVRKSASIEGKLYGVPFQKDLSRIGIVIRKDWLDNLGLDMPKTTEDLMKVAQAFTEDDPDGNGKDDTVGLLDRSDLVYSSFKTLATYFGAPNKWDVDEQGNFTPEFETEGYVKAMDYLKKMYDNGWVNKDFAVMAKTDQQQTFAQGKAGIYFGGLFDGQNFQNMAKGIQDDMELDLINDMTSTDYNKRVIWSEGNGVGGVLAFPRSEVKDEAELKKLLQFINDLHDEELYTLMTYGLEGTHYEEDADGLYKIIDQNLWQQEVQPLAASRPRETGYESKDPNPIKQKSNEMIAENADYAVLNPAVPLESATYSSQGTELQKIITDATYQYILGEIDMKGFKKAVQSWEDQGGKTIKEEYKEAYKASQ